VIPVWAAPLIAVVLSAGLTRLLATTRSRFFTMIDVPNDRSLHDRPTPRGGGLGIVAGVAVAGALSAIGAEAPQGLGLIAGSAALVAVASFLDDKFTVPALYRLLVHLVAGALLAWAGFGPGELAVATWSWTWPAWVAGVFAVLYVAWMINLYNFMDGMDGFAGGMAVLGFGAFAALGLMDGDTGFAVASLVVCTASAGFLLFNFPPARIFMGDVGSSVLGLLAGAFALWADRDGVFPLWVGVLVFSPFVVDSSVTLVRRGLRKERLWHAHRTHFYQRVVQLGWSHRKTVLAEYLLMALCAGSAIAVVADPAPVLQWSIVIAWATGYVGLMVAVTMFERRAGAQITRSGT